MSNIEQNLFIERIRPNYLETEPLVSLEFSSETEFQAWFTTIASRHAHWIKNHSKVNLRNAKAVEGIPAENLKACSLVKESEYIVCDHGRSRAVKTVEATEVTLVSNESTTIKKRRVAKRGSIKVNCTAKITKISLFSGKINVAYEWKHVNHDPLDKQELSSSRLPQVIKDWINEQVQSNMDWKAIKATLRLSEQSLDNVS